MKSIGGYHQFDDSLSSWPQGSMWESEGQRLYELIREHKPEKIIEIGAHYGCSTTWIATAIKHNKKGRLYSYDVNPEAWSMLPKSLKKYVECIVFDCWNLKAECDLLFEDGAHSSRFTATMLQNIKAKIVVVHDYFHPSCQIEVKDEFIEVLGEPDETFIKSPADCGLAIKYL